eukprot:1821149-Pyramimonas_sp.AAC.1
MGALGDITVGFGANAAITASSTNDNWSGDYSGPFTELVEQNQYLVGGTVRDWPAHREYSLSPRAIGQCFECVP